jgi:hypothetical protein
VNQVAQITREGVNQIAQLEDRKPLIRQCYVLVDLNKLFEMKTSLLMFTLRTGLKGNDDCRSNVTWERVQDA